jgi:phenylpyruvate tautomerase PptA (4-oxalocrotonate tautomerase family)
MPLVRITLPEGLAPEIPEIVSRAVHRNLIREFLVPPDDYFQILEEIPGSRKRYPARYLEIDHSELITFIQITAAQGRTEDQKRRLYAGIARDIASDTPIPPEDVIIVLVENAGAENWSFGNGEIQKLVHLTTLVSP